MYSMNDITTLYVSQKEGDNDCQGFFPCAQKDMTGPLKSIETALELVADLRRSGGLQPITIKIMDDIYCLEKPLLLDGKVSDVTIEPFSRTLLSGGIRVEGFREDTFNGVRCVSADLSRFGELSFTDFYVNGKRADFTRYPKEGTLKPADVENHSTALNAHSRWFIAAKEDLETISGFRNFGDCFISYNHYWVDEHSPIQDYDLESGRITFRYPSRFSIELTHSRSALEYVIENVAEGFRNPNEWYYDRPARKVYYIPADEGQRAEDITAFVPVAEKLICVTGAPEKKVRNILIRNFDIAYTKGDFTSKEGTDAAEQDFECYASDGQAVSTGRGSIEFRHAYGCALENCRLFCLGIHAVVAEEGCQGIRITGNRFMELGAGAVKINGGEYGTDPALHTFGNLVSNNEIFRCGLRYFAACGILLMHSYDNMVSHNTISQLYYTGISCGWVWGYGESISRNNLIEKNHIHHIGQGKLSDMGGIYLLGRQPGTVVRGNLIHHVESCHYGGWALYTDEGSSFILLENNVCYDTSSNCFYQHYGQMNTVRNNIFALSKESPVKLSRREMHTAYLLERNIIVTDGKPAYMTGYGSGGAGLIHMLSSNHNLFYDISGKEPVIWSVGDEEYTLEQMQEKFGKDVASVVADPGFEDAAGRDFSLKKDSKAVALGFVPIDIRDCGAAGTGA